MKLNRVLQADMLASQLEKYRASIVIAENKPIEPAKHRQPVKDFLTTFDHHDEFYTETNLHQQQIPNSNIVIPHVVEQEPVHPNSNSVLVEETVGSESLSDTINHNKALPQEIEIKK